MKVRDLISRLNVELDDSTVKHSFGRDCNLPQQPMIKYLNQNEEFKHFGMTTNSNGMNENKCFQKDSK